MKVLVTGANGQVGIEVQLLAPTQPDWEFHFHDVDTLDITNSEQHSFFHRFCLRWNEGLILHRRRCDKPP